jgi:site-specific DNA recombinase
VRGRQISEEFPTLTPDAIRSILLAIISRIDIREEQVEIRLYRHRLHALLQVESLEPSLAASVPANNPGDMLRLKVKARLQRVGREMKLVVHNVDGRAAANRCSRA